MKKVFLCLLMFCAVLLPFRARALPVIPTDFGDYGGDTDYDYDYDTGGDYDYDYDYGGDDTYYYGSLDSDGDGEIDPIIIIIIVVIVVYSWLKSNKKSKKTSGSRPVQNPNGELRSMDSYQQVDSAFDGVALQSRVANLYVRLQEAWMARNLETVRSFLSPELMGSAENQIQNYISSNRYPKMDRISVLSVDLLGWSQDGVNDRIVCRLRTRLVDYVTDSYGNVVSGSNTAEKMMVYEWTMIRPIGEKTGTYTGIDKCPNCGGPIDFGQSTRCPYCDTIINSARYDWTLSSIRAISQQTQG